MNQQTSTLCLIVTIATILKRGLTLIERGLSEKKLETQAVESNYMVRLKFKI